MMVQAGGGGVGPLSLPSLTQYFQQPVLPLPVFNGIELPKPPQPDFNPFGDGNGEGSDDGFGDFDDFQTPTQSAPNSTTDTNLQSSNPAPMIDLLGSLSAPVMPQDQVANVLE